MLDLGIVAPAVTLVAHWLLDRTPRGGVLAGIVCTRFTSIDAANVALVRRMDCPYCYSFDDDFDAIDAVTRLDAPVDPYAPD